MTHNSSKCALENNIISSFREFQCPKKVAKPWDSNLNFNFVLRFDQVTTRTKTVRFKHCK